jgi:hypothetical protein
MGPLAQVISNTSWGEKHKIPPSRVDMIHHDARGMYDLAFLLFAGRQDKY